MPFNLSDAINHLITSCDGGFTTIQVLFYSRIGMPQSSHQPCKICCLERRRDIRPLIVLDRVCKMLTEFMDALCDAECDIRYMLRYLDQRGPRERYLKMRESFTNDFTYLTGI